MTWQNIAMLGGGLGLFLFGMHMMGGELERAAGNKLRHLLEVLTKNRFLGLLVGIVFTMLVQSSSATTVMIVGFVNAGLMNLYQAASVIIGANIGTTITAQLIAFKLTDIAPFVVLAGVIMTQFFKKASVRQVGGIMLGFGILFVGLGMMSDAMVPLRTMPEVAAMFAQFKNPFLGILVGMVITAVIQSSSASVGILQVLAAQGAIGLDAAVYVVLGQNIGTCITALIAAIGGSKMAVRTAMIHLVYNILGVAIFVVFMQFAPVVSWMEMMTADPMRQIANFHVFFNLFATLALFPFMTPMVKLCIKLVPGEDPVREDMRLQYITENMLQTPPAAVMQLMREIKRMQKLASENIDRAMTAFLHGGANKVTEEIEHTEEVLDFLSDEITRYLVMLNQTELSEKDANLSARLYHTVSDIERVGDHAENILERAQMRETHKVPISGAAKDELAQMYGYVKELLSMAQESFDVEDGAMKKRAAELEDKVDGLEDELRLRHLERLDMGQCTSESGLLFTDVIMNLERVADHAVNIIGIEE